MGVKKFLIGAGAVVGGVILAPVILPAAAAAGAAVAATSAGAAVGAGLATVGGAVGAAAGAVGATSVATIAGTTAGATAVGAIATSSVVGVTSAANGVSKMAKASSIKKDAEDKYNSERGKYDSQERETNQSMEELGKIKVSVWDRFSEFEETFNKIHNLELSGSVAVEKRILLDKNRLENVHVLALSAKSVMKNGVLSLSSGQLIGAAASTGITSVATASTGTAISSLSGAAASNASLAALGGGALNAGGLGMAGGAVVSSVLTFAPAAAIGGLFLSGHGRKSLKSAEALLDESETLVKDMQEAESELKKLSNLADKLRSAIIKYDNSFAKLLTWLKQLVSLETNAERYSEEELTKVFATYRLMEILYDLTTKELYHIDNDNAPVINTNEISKTINDSDRSWNEYTKVQEVDENMLLKNSLDEDNKLRATQLVDDISEAGYLSQPDKESRSAATMMSEKDNTKKLQDTEKAETVFCASYSLALVATNGQRYNIGCEEVSRELDSGYLVSKGRKLATYRRNNALNVVTAPIDGVVFYVDLEHHAKNGAVEIYCFVYVSNRFTNKREFNTWFNKNEKNDRLEEVLRETGRG